MRDARCRIALDDCLFVPATRNTKSRSQVESAPAFSYTQRSLTAYGSGSKNCVVATASGMRHVPQRAEACGQCVKLRKATGRRMEKRCEWQTCVKTEDRQAEAGQVLRGGIGEGEREGGNIRRQLRVSG